MICTNVNVYVTHAIFLLKKPFFLLRAVGATGGSISSGVGE